MLGALRKSNELENGDLSIQDSAPKSNLAKNLEPEFKQSCAPNLNCCSKLSWPKFRFDNHGPENWKILSLSGLSWLEAWITFALRNTFEFLAPSRSLSCIDWINQFCGSRFSIAQLALKAGSSVACAFKGLDNVYLEAFRQILRRNCSEAE